MRCWTKTVLAQTSAILSILVLVELLARLLSNMESTLFPSPPIPSNLLEDNQRLRREATRVYSEYARKKAVFLASGRKDPPR